jgi:hypothetical protein
MEVEAEVHGNFRSSERKLPMTTTLETSSKIAITADIGAEANDIL